MDMSYINEIVKIYDGRAGNSVYRNESSRLGDINLSYPAFKGKYFSQHVEDIARSGGVSVFEFGGGPRQVAAREILKKDGISSYVAYEVKPLEESVKEELLKSENYKFIQGGLADLNSKEIGRSKFNLVFAHDVAIYLPHPFLLLKELYSLTANGGLIFIDGIQGYEDRIRSLVKKWEEQSYRFEYRIRTPDSVRRKAGIVKLDLVIEKTRSNLLVPDAAVSHIKAGGRDLATLDCCPLSVNSNSRSNFSMNFTKPLPYCSQPAMDRIGGDLFPSEVFIFDVKDLERRRN